MSQRNLDDVSSIAGSVTTLSERSGFVGATLGAPRLSSTGLSATILSRIPSTSTSLRIPSTSTSLNTVAEENESEEEVSSTAGQKI